MNYQEKTVLLKNGKACFIRRTEPADAEMMLEYLRTTSAETRYMTRGPEEVRTDVEEERAFIQKMCDDPRALLLMAEVDGRHAGGCSFNAVLDRSRIRHRCTVGISIYRAFWGMGIGTALMSELLRCAKAVGYEQAELDVVSTNEPAIGLYKKLGFEVTGTIPHAFKYQDGSYADFLYMVKDLT